MTNKTIEDVEHLNQLNKKVSEMVSRWVNEAKEEGIKIGLGADKAELIEKLLQENKALREQAAQTTLPSREEFYRKHAEVHNYPSMLYDWLRDNMKPKERHEMPSFRELEDWYIVRALSKREPLLAEIYSWFAEKIK